MSIKIVLFSLLASSLHVEAGRKNVDYQVLAGEEANDEDQVLSSEEANDEEQVLSSEEANDEEQEHRAENYSLLDTEQCVASACVEKGKWDRDCCAKPTTGSCKDGYVFTYGGKCSANGFNTCCTKLPSMEAYGECVKPACMENGKIDTDCCAAKGKGSCQDGFEFSAEGNCHRNGAKATCCKQLPFTFKRPSVEIMIPTGAHVKEACLEKGKWDKDCCARPGEGSCMDGFAFSYGESCSAVSFAYETVCKELPKKNANGACAELACMENGKYDKDCCAKPGSGSCQDGFQFSFGERCASNGAKRTCCTQLPLPF